MGGPQNFSSHHKVNKIIQISNLTQPVFELHIWPWPLLILEGDTGSVLFNTASGSSKICSTREIFQSTLTYLASGGAERTGVITLF